MDTTQAKPFSKAELEHLKDKAMAANMAIAVHNEFVTFLRQQHDAPEQDGWMLGTKGFEMAEKPAPPDEGKVTPPPAITGEGVNGIVTEEVEKLS